MPLRADNQHTSRGIQELIDEIREKGVDAGKEESKRIVADAEQRAEWILSQAGEQAASIRESAEREAKFVREAGAESLELAYRDIRMKLRDELAGQFARQLQLLIVQELENPDTLRQLLMSAAGRSELGDEPMTIVLPDRAVGLEELREDPASLQGGPLIEMVSEVARQLFESGVTVEAGGGDAAGVRVLLRDGEVSVELTDQGLSDLILDHLQPRFRAILEGVVG